MRPQTDFSLGRHRDTSSKQALESVASVPPMPPVSPVSVVPIPFVVAPPSLLMPEQLQLLYKFTKQRARLAANNEAPRAIFSSADRVNVGNNGQVWVRIIERGVYVGPTTQNFIDRGRSMFNAALVILGYPRGQIPPELKGLWDSFFQQIKTSCNLDLSQMSQSSKETEEYFFTIYSRAVLLLSQLCAALSERVKNKQIENLKLRMNEEISECIGDRSKGTVRKYYEEIIKQVTIKDGTKVLRQQEQSQILGDGRANLINFIAVSGCSTQLVSCLSTVTPVTVPSSITTKGNRNFVRSQIWTHHVDNDFLEDDSLRLGAICAFEEHDPLKRKWQNAQNALELLQVAAAAKIISAGLNVDNYSLDSNVPLELNIFTTTLVSPYKKVVSQWLSTLGILPSEHTMLTEHNEALKFYHNCVIELEITLANGEKKIILVKPRIMHYNIPTNISSKRTIQHWGVSQDQQYINAEGAYEYFKEAEKYLKDRWLVPTEYKSGRYEGIADAIAEIRNELIKNIFYLNNNDSLKAPQESLNAVLNSHRADLANKNEELLRVIRDLNSNPNNKTALERYHKLVDSIKVTNELIYKAYVDVMAAKSAVYKNIKKNLYRNYQNIQELLVKHKDFLAKPENHSLRQQLLAAQAYINSQRIMFDEDPQVNYKVRENAFLLLAYMHMVMFAAKVTHTSGCKSAKDRTGLLNIVKEAIILFVETYGYYPDPRDNGHRERLQDIIAQQVYQSPSAVNSMQNDPGAYGLQIPFAISHAMGLLAKKPYSTRSDISSELTLLSHEPIGTPCALNPHVSKLSELYIQLGQIITSGKKNDSLVTAIRKLEKTVFELNEANYFDEFNRFVIASLPKSNDEIFKIIQQKLIERDKIIHIIEDQKNKQIEVTMRAAQLAKQSSMPSLNPVIVPATHTLNPKTTQLLRRPLYTQEMLPEQQLVMLDEEIKYLQNLRELRQVIKYKLAYLEFSMDENIATFKAQYILDQLESHNIASEKRGLDDAIKEIKELHTSTEITQQGIDIRLRNLNKCRVAIVIREAQEGLLPTQFAHLEKNNDKEFLDDQYQLVRQAVEQLDEKLTKISEVITLRELNKNVNDPILKNLKWEGKNLMSYIANLQYYMRLLSGAKEKLENVDREASMLSAPAAAGNKKEGNRPRAITVLSGKPTLGGGAAL